MMLLTENQNANALSKQPLLIITKKQLLKAAIRNTRNPNLKKISAKKTTDLILRSQKEEKKRKRPRSSVVYPFRKKTEKMKFQNQKKIKSNNKPKQNKTRMLVLPMAIRRQTRFTRIAATIILILNSTV